MSEAKTGRKPKHDYTDKMLLLHIEGWARDGYDDKQIAELLLVTDRHFCKLKNQYSELGEALTRGRRPLEVLVENSLFKRATGMKVTRTSVTKKREFNPATGEYEINIYDMTEVTELPPDVNAQHLWLRNRKPDKWNTQPAKIDHTTNGKEVQGTQLVFMDAPMSEEDMAEILRIKNGNAPPADGNNKGD